MSSPTFTSETSDSAFAIQPCFIFCGGGTGGHLFPALAVCEELRVRTHTPPRIVFITTGKPIENRILASETVEVVQIPSVSSIELRRNPLRSMWTLLKAMRCSRRLLQQMQPQVVIGLGGYGSLPGMLAAKSLRVPTLLMEQNRIPGKANSILSRFCDRLCTSFPETQGHVYRGIRTMQTGNPVRKQICQILLDRHNSKNRESNEVKVLLNAEPVRTLTILGGSQGATTINSAMELILRNHTEYFRGWEVIHQTGSEDNAALVSAYEKLGIKATVFSFLDDMASVYSKTDLVLSRAGGTTLAELAVLGLPAILVPIPNSVRNHQVLNAEFFHQQGGAVIVSQSSDPVEFAQRLSESLRMLLTTPKMLAHMQLAMKTCGTPDAAIHVAEEILKLSKE